MWDDNKTPERFQGFFFVHDNKAKEEKRNHTRVVQLIPFGEGYTAVVHEYAAVPDKSYMETFSKEKLLETFDFDPRDLAALEEPE